MDYRTELSGLSRNDLNIIARKLGIKNYSHGPKEELVESIVSTRTPKQIKKIVSPSLWNRYHNHIYGIASVMGFMLAVWALIPKSPQESQRLSESVAITTPSSSEPAPHPLQTAPKSSPTLVPTPTQISNFSPSQKRPPAQRMESALDHVNRARTLLGRGPEYYSAALAECNSALRLEPKNQAAIELRNSIIELQKQ